MDTEVKKLTAHLDAQREAAMGIDPVEAEGIAAAGGGS